MVNDTMVTLPFTGCVLLNFANTNFTEHQTNNRS